MDSRILFQVVWTLQAPVEAAQPLVIRYRMDANQVLHLRLQRAKNAQQPEAQLRVENPLTNVQRIPFSRRSKPNAWRDYLTTRP